MQHQKTPGSAGVSGIPLRETVAIQGPCGGFRHTGFLPLSMGKNRITIDALKNKKKGLESHCLRGLLRQKFNFGGLMPYRDLGHLSCEFPPKNRVIGNRYVKNPLKHASSLITGTAKRGVKPCRH